MSKSSEAVKRWRANTKDRMVKAMGGKCQGCGYNKCNEALAFHHIDPTQKDLEFSDTRANPKRWELLAIELRKCILVCHVCHSEIHAGIRQIPDVYEKFNEEYLNYKKVFEQSLDKCPICNNEKYISHKFCSHTCAATNRRKVDWDSIDLLKLMKEHTISELEDMLGISNAAIYKRRNKLLKI